MIKLCVRRRFYQARQECAMKTFVHSTFERMFSFDFTASENSNEAHTENF